MAILTTQMRRLFATGRSEMRISMKNEKMIKGRYSWEDLRQIIHVLRAPDGCPWDRAQSYESMVKGVADEAAEVVCAVENGDIVNLEEELGDLLLQVFMYSEIAQERGDFTLEDVVDGLAKKMVRRHPNVFDDGTKDEEVEHIMNELNITRWEAVKKKEKMQKLPRYEEMYNEGKISKELLEEYRQKCAE